MLTAAMTAPRTRKPAATKPAPSTEAATRSLADVGREAAKAAQRKVLLAALRSHKWNLSAAGAAVGVKGSANVIRFIHSLDLTAEYDAARIRKIAKS